MLAYCETYLYIKMLIVHVEKIISIAHVDESLWACYSS